MKNWLRAEKELSYRIKQEVNDLLSKGYKWNNAIDEARTKVSSEIEFRAYLIYCATKDYTIDNWLKAEQELNSRADFYKNYEEYAEYLVQENNNQLNRKAASIWAELEFKKVRAYYLWKNEYDMKLEWYDAERYFDKKIAEKSKEILTKNPYLSQDEAFYFSHDQFYDEVKQKAESKRKWVIERAYYLSLQNPDNSEEYNWYLAVKEYNAKHLEVTE